jgi:hypothetical protein
LIFITRILILIYLESSLPPAMPVVGGGSPVHRQLTGGTRPDRTGLDQTDSQVEPHLT